MKSCKIIVRDEVNVKIENLDVADRRHLQKMFTYEIPGARYMPAVRLGRWDGKASYFSVAGSTYINLLDEIIPVLESRNYEIQLEDQRIINSGFQFTAVDENSFSNISWPQGHELQGQPILLRDYQVEVINKFLHHPQAIGEVATGAGKCQPYSSKVLTPSGWTTMGELKVGDDIITPAGKTAKVVNVYDPGVKDVYEITFEDGRTARSCEDHIWRVYNIDWGRSKTGRWRNISLREVMNLINRTKRTIGIPLVNMDHDQTSKDMPIDPWLMGFLLGDGSFRNNVLTFSTSDSEMVDKVKSILMQEYIVKHISRYDYKIMFKDKETKNTKHSELLSKKQRNELGHIIKNKQSSNYYIQTIIDLGLKDKLSHEKFIPEIYFTGSKQQRMELIRGLVDSDGTVDKSSVSFTTTSEQLAIGFQKLIHSIGGIAKIKVKNNNWYVYNNQRKLGKSSYTVYTRFSKPWELMSLTRKKNDTNYFYQYGATLKLGITEIKKVSTELVRCIMIDDPDHLYITDDYVVTHNTIITAALSQRVQQFGRSIVIVPNKSLVVQTERDYRNLGLDVGVYFQERKEADHQHIICTWQSLNNIYKQTRDGEAQISVDEFIKDVVCVIVDEAHAAKAEALKSLMTQVFKNVPIRWGLTGTIPKDKYASVALLTGIGPVIHRLAAAELQDRGILAACHVNIIQLQDHVEFKAYPTELKYLLENSERLDEIAAIISKITQSGNTLILVDRISAGTALAERLPDSTFISGGTKMDDRKAEYEEISQQDNKILIATYGIAAVGINIPRIFNLVLIEPGKSFVRVIQSIGRGIRKAEDKDYVDIYDLTSSCKFSKRHLTERKNFYREANYPFTVTKREYRK